MALAAGAATADDSAAHKELAPTGKLRVGIAVGPSASALWTVRDAATGRPKGVPVELGTAMAKKLGVPVELVEHASSGEIVNARDNGTWDVTFLPFSLGQSHVAEGETTVWERPEIDSGIVALQVAVAVRDTQPERFVDVHHGLFEHRHAAAGALRTAAYLDPVLTAAGVVWWTRDKPAADPSLVELQAARADLAASRLPDAQRRLRAVLARWPLDAETHFLLARACRRATLRRAFSRLLPPCACGPCCAGNGAARSRRCRSQRGLSTFSPVERAAKLLRPRSTPTAASTAANGTSRTSTTKEAW